MRYQFQSRVLSNNQYKLFDYLAKRFKDFHKQNEMASEFDSEDGRFVPLVMQFLSNYHQDFQKTKLRFLQECLYSSTIGVSLGMRRAGKTCFLSWKAEQMHLSGRPVYALNYSDKAPSWINIIDYDPEKPYYQCKYNAYIIHDEIHNDIDSKNWNSPKNAEFRKWLATSGHKGYSIDATSQLASNIPLDLIRYAESLHFKQMNRISEDEDRANFLKPFSFFYPECIQDNLCYVNNKLFFFDNPVPDFYTKELSEAFK